MPSPAPKPDKLEFVVSNVSPALTSLLESLVAGIEATPEQIPVLSDLDRYAAVEVRRLWPEIDPEIRASLLAQAIELSVDDVSVDFTALGVVGLDDSDAEVRQLAVETLWESEDSIVGQRLLTLLQAETDIEVRIALAASLRPFVLLREFEQLDPALGDAIVSALAGIARAETEPSELRAVALESLGARSLADVTRLIEDAYDNDDPRMQLAAVRAMGVSADERWLEYLAERMQSADPAFREEAAVAAGNIASEDAVEGLVDLLQDEVPEVVIAAIGALGEIGGEEALRLLEEMSRDAPGEFVEALTSALEAIRELSFTTGGGSR